MNRMLAFNCLDRWSCFPLNSERLQEPELLLCSFPHLYTEHIEPLRLVQILLTRLLVYAFTFNYYSAAAGQGEHFLMFFFSNWFVQKDPPPRAAFLHVKTVRKKSSQISRNVFVFLYLSMYGIDIVDTHFVCFNNTWALVIFAQQR